MKKGQIRMTETIAVLFIFFILILFGLIFYARYQKVALEQQAEENLAKRAMDITTKSLFLPELVCSKGEAEPEKHCLDLMKLRSLNKTIKKNIDNYYFDLFSFAKITVQEIYPGNETWELYHQPKQDFIRVEPTYFVVSLRESLPEIRYRYGYIKVEVYS